MATFRSPAVALMPDVTPKPLRSKANAVINLMGSAGGIIVLALGMVFGTPVGQRAVLPMAGMPAGGFIVLGVLCAVWRALAARRKAYLVREARSLVDVHAQKEADGEQ